MGQNFTSFFSRASNAPCVTSVNNFSYLMGSYLEDGTYKKGVKVCGDEKTVLEQRLQRSSLLHWWDITIQPKTVNL